MSLLLLTGPPGSEETTVSTVRLYDLCLAEQRAGRQRHLKRDAQESSFGSYRIHRPIGHCAP